MHFGVIMSSGRYAEILETRSDGFLVVIFGGKRPRFISNANFWVLS